MLLRRVHMCVCDYAHDHVYLICVRTYISCPERYYDVYYVCPAHVDIESRTQKPNALCAIIHLSPYASAIVCCFTSVRLHALLTYTAIGATYHADAIRGERR